MKHKLVLSVVILFSALPIMAQQLPLNWCGIVNIYDATGNRTKRTYFCNNGGAYPQRTAGQSTVVIGGNVVLADFQEVDALYPNPTSGRFSVTFSKALNNATIHIMDATGKIITRMKAKGYKVYVDLSIYAVGVYFVHVEEGDFTITKKVVKQ